MEILKVENLTKIYGEHSNKVVALDNVSFSVEKGEFVAIVGASGSGKSTLLHLIGGVDRPTSGKVFIDGKQLQECMEFEKIADGGMAREKILLGEDEYFLLGDNRNHSKDSRNTELGIVNQSQIDGKVFWQIYPFDKMGNVD